MVYIFKDLDPGFDGLILGTFSEVEFAQLWLSTNGYEHDFDDCYINPETKHRSRKFWEVFDEYDVSVKEKEVVLGYFIYHKGHGGVVGLSNDDEMFLKNKEDAEKVAKIFGDEYGVGAV